MNELPSHQGWLQAIAEAADAHRIVLPAFESYGMGALRSASTADGRFITLKRRTGIMQGEGVEWAFWHQPRTRPEIVAAFRESVEPTPAGVAETLKLLAGWMVDQWPLANTKQAVAKHHGAQVIKEPPDPSERREYWLSSDRGFGVVVRKDDWGIQADGKPLTSWRERSSDEGSDWLELSKLDRFCSWLAEHWNAIAFGDVRPEAMRGYQAAACRAYETAELTQASQKNSEVADWWRRHAIRAADAELPNIFLERQADDIVISWDASPAHARFYQLKTDDHVARVNIAIPELRNLIGDRIAASGTESKSVAQVLLDNPSAGFAALSRYSSDSHVNEDWLQAHSFTAIEARDFAISGTSRHPIVGLLRSSQGSALKARDFDAILNKLTISKANSFSELRQLAKDLNASIDTREPWESGYQLARLVRDRLKLDNSPNLDIEGVIRSLGVEIHDLPFDDTSILGACVGTPGYAPFIVINENSPDAKGISGRRVTLAHELCHLLFDRAGQRSLARFEGGSADGDRLVEMRANAFAVEFLVPMSALVGDSGEVIEDAALAQMAEDWKVSFHALQKHARNLRSRLAR